MTIDDGLTAPRHSEAVSSASAAADFGPAPDGIRIRPAVSGDADEITRLSAELGYPMPDAEMARRLAAIVDDDRHAVAVAEIDGRVVGWMHVEHRRSLEGGERAELMGLVIGDEARRRGIGRALVAAAEHWAAGRSLGTITVRSNVAREQSHPFYAVIGYAREKTQHVYRKTLGSSQ